MSEFFDFLIGLTVLAVLVLALIGRRSASKEIQNLKKEFPRAKTHISDFDTSFLIIDFERKKIVVGIQKTRKNPLERPYKMSFAFSDIMKAEMVSDSTQVAITKTNRGSQLLGAAAGAIALGGVGAVIGGLSASSTSTTLNGAKRVAIRITVDNSNKPIHDVTFYASKDKKGGKQGEKLFDRTVQKALEFGAYLDSAIRESEKEQDKHPENNQPENNQVSDVSEQISRLWQLKQEGALTQEEFEKQKAKLLQS